MNETNVKTRQLQLLTYEKGSNHFYDSTFSVPLDFKPNARGLYNITINEVLFRNDECLLEANKDWYKITITWSDNTTSWIRYDVNTNITSTQDAPNQVKIHNVLQGKNYVNKTYSSDADRLAFNDTNQYTQTMYRINVQGDSETASTTKALINIPDKNGYADKYMGYEVMGIKAAFTGKTLSKIEIEASNNFLYMFHNLFNKYEFTRQLSFYPDATLNGTPNYEVANTRWFEIHNLQRNGPLEYVLDTNINTATKTINENGQAYNVMARTYNLSTFHNSIQQLNSTMTGTVKDLTNLRMRIVNDFFEPIHLFNPVLICLTVSNSD